MRPMTFPEKPLERRALAVAVVVSLAIHGLVLFVNYQEPQRRAQPHLSALGGFELALLLVAELGARRLAPGSGRALAAHRGQSGAPGTPRSAGRGASRGAPGLG